MHKRIHLVVLDSVGIGEAPDALEFGDVGSNTLGNISKVAGLNVPNLEAMGLGNIAPLETVKPVEEPNAYFTKLEEQSVGKDTMTGHWEIAGLQIDTPFRVFPEGFPEDLIEQIKTYTGRGVVANHPASGTEIIDEWGAHQMETGDLIIYTSADPVLQIAAHEEIIPLDELYDICQYVRDITKEDPYMIGRIIARPFIGEPGNFKRTSNRHDYALDPFDKTMLDHLKEADYDVVSIGKIIDIFNEKGITEDIRTESNMDGVDKLLDVMKKDFKGLSFTNLVDFDALYGHRRDPEGYRDAIEEFDARIPEIVENLREDDLLILTADHGNDPTFEGTDHTREYVPLLVYSPKFQNTGKIRQGYFADISATILDNFGLKPMENGSSLLNELN